MAAGMHLAGDQRTVLASRDLLDVQRIEIGAQANRPLTRQTSLQCCDHAGSGNALGHLQPPTAQAVRHQGGGTGFLEADFGVTVDIVADLDQLGLVVFQTGKQCIRCHGYFPG